MTLRFAVLLALVAAAVSEECNDASCSEDAVNLLQATAVTETASAADPDKPASKTPPAASTEPAAAATTEVSTFDFRAGVAEYIAMTLFVIIGCGSAMGIAKEAGSAWIFQVALAFGLGITVLAYAFGKYSGGQINCAVTLALVISGHCSIMQGLLNTFAQLAGAVTGALILTAICPEDQDKTGGLGTNSVPEGRTLNALVGEAAMTFLLVIVVFETAVNPAAKANAMVAPLAIGFAVFLAHSVLIPLDGCSINPTRSLGPALVRKYYYKAQGSLSDMWVFWAGPLIGAVGAAVVSTLLMGH